MPHVFAVPAFETLERRRLLAAAYAEGAVVGVKAAATKQFLQAPKKAAKPDLLASSDDGVRDHDNVTSLTNLVFEVEKVSAGTTVQLLRDGVVVASVYSADGGTVLLADSGPVPLGAHAYTARLVSGFGVVGDQSPALRVEVIAGDTVIPAAPAAPDLDDASDSGASDVDNLTSAMAPSFTISGVESGLTVRLMRDGAVVASGVATSTAITLTDATSHGDGSYSYTAVAVNAAGQVSPLSGALVVVFDATAPGAGAVDLSAGSDLGLSDGDNITPVNSGLAFEISGAEAGASVELLRDGVVVASGISAGGAMSLSDPASLADGVYHYSTRVTDLAGNVSTAGAALDVTVDTSAPATPVLSLASDSGIADGVTRHRRPVFTVSGVEAGALLQLLDADGNVVASVVSTGGEILIQGDVLLAPGTHTFRVRQVDAAGNVSPLSGETSVKIVNALAASDYDGDGVSDVAIYTDGEWTIHLSSGGVRTETFGSSTSLPVPGDYDGDGLTDLAIYRPGSRVFSIIPSSDPETARIVFIGTVNQIPVPADYDGDGMTDVAVYNYATGVFTIARSSGGTITQMVGSGGALPAPADYDGDAKADPAVYDPATGNWIIARSTGGTVTVAFGAGDGSDQPITGDFDGDGFDDLAVYNPTSGQFSVFASGGGTLSTVASPGELAFAADFDGDNTFDLATYSQASAVMSIFRSSGGTSAIGIGTPGAANQPLPLSSALARKDVLGF